MQRPDVTVSALIKCVCEDTIVRRLLFWITTSPMLSFVRAVNANEDMDGVRAEVLKSLGLYA
jgi:hypothetical protein